jgi:hypothetical protein
VGRSSPWVFVGIGCLLTILVAVATVVGLGWWGVRTAERWGEEMKDPRLQHDKALAALGAAELPPGLSPAMSLSVPFLMDVTILTDRPPSTDERGEVDIEDAARGLVYVRSRTLTGQRADLRSFLTGERTGAEALDNLNIQMGGFELEAGQETVARGGFAIGEVRHLYATQRQRHGTGAEQRSMLESLVMVECPDDELLRLAVWFGPDPSGSAAEMPAEAPAGERPAVELTGTPADEAALRDLFAGFDLCR